ncbi:MAG: DUF559 domain-containing protein [Pseudomonadota bacterium]
MPRYARMRHHTAAARALRKSPTLAERRFWQAVRREGIGLTFRRQHPALGFVLDFYAPSVRLAVELDGGQHALSAGSDAMRTAILNRHGVSVLRFWNNEVLGNLGGVLLCVQAVARSLAAETPSPSLPLGGGGGDIGGLPFETLRLSLAERVKTC